MKTETTQDLKRQIETMGKQLDKAQNMIFDLESKLKILPTVQDVKRWHQLLVGLGNEEMMKDVEATFKK